MTESGFYGFNDSPIVALLTKSIQQLEEKLKKNDEVMKNTARAHDGKHSENNSVLERSGKK